MTKTHEFTIVASGLDPEMEGYEDRFFDAGCDDATLSFQKGVIIAEFAREAVSFSKAVSSAYEDVMRTGAKVERVEPDYLVSLSDIAERSGLTRQADLAVRARRTWVGISEPGGTGYVEQPTLGLARSQRMAARPCQD